MLDLETIDTGTPIGSGAGLELSTAGGIIVRGEKLDPMMLLYLLLEIGLNHRAHTTHRISTSNITQTQDKP